MNEDERKEKHGKTVFCLFCSLAGKTFAYDTLDYGVKMMLADNCQPSMPPHVQAIDENDLITEPKCDKRRFKCERMFIANTHQLSTGEQEIEKKIISRRHMNDSQIHTNTDIYANGERMLELNNTMAHFNIKLLSV